MSENKTIICSKCGTPHSSSYYRCIKCDSILRKYENEEISWTTTTRNFLDNWSVDVGQKIKKYARRYFIINVILKVIAVPVATIALSAQGYDEVEEIFFIFLLFLGAAFVLLIFDYLVAFIIHTVGCFYENIEKTARYQETTYNLLAGGQNGAQTAVHAAVPGENGRAAPRENNPVSAGDLPSL